MHKAGQKIAAEIRASGVIPFSRFMELALYCPDCGYYEAEADKIGRKGDFFTSVSVGPLFGQLLGFQFARWFQEWAKTCLGPAKIAEAGAHDGTLARDILIYLRQHCPDIFESVEYWIVEPSERRKELQVRLLGDLACKVRWTSNLGSLRDAHPEGFRGVIFANELLDAMPVHRLCWDAKGKQWFEWGVTLQGDRFVWVRPGRARSPSEPSVSPDTPQGSGRLGEAALPSRVLTLLPQLPPALLDVLPDGFSTEVSPAALDWWTHAARILSYGALLTFDYGLTTEEFLLPHRAEGTLRAYRSHRLSPDVLADPGEQDITAHVNFSLLEQAGESAGLRTASFVTQEQFLTGIVKQLWSEASSSQTWNAQLTNQLRTLTDPTGLGRFKVLLQTRLG